MLTSKRLHVFIRSCKCLTSSRETSSGSILGACWSFTTCKYWELAHVRPLSEQKRSYTSDAMRWIHPEADGKPRSHAHAAAYQSFQARGRSSCCQRWRDVASSHGEHLPLHAMEALVFRLGEVQAVNVWSLRRW
jgi:hypothetical protein